MNKLKTLAEDLAGLFFPNICVLCKNELLSAEQHLCTTCITTLPETNFHKQIENPLTSKMLGRFPFEKIIALYYFNTEGQVQEILHEIKYRKNKQLAKFMGSVLATKLRDALQDINVILPIPLHTKRLQDRGFNQSAIIAQQLATDLKKVYHEKIVSRIKNTETQTNKNRSQRMDNMENAFAWSNDENLKNAHILLVDDVITTGATIESCILAAPPNFNLKFSVLTLAAAVDS